MNKSGRGDQKRWYIMRRNSQNHQISQKPTISQIVCFLNRKCTTLFQRLRTLYITIQLRFTFFDIPYEWLIIGREITLCFAVKAYSYFLSYSRWISDNCERNNTMFCCRNIEILRDWDTSVSKPITFHVEMLKNTRLSCLS